MLIRMSERSSSCVPLCVSALVQICSYLHDLGLAVWRFSRLASLCWVRASCPVRVCIDSFSDSFLSDFAFRLHRAPIAGFLKRSVRCSETLLESRFSCGLLNQCKPQPDGIERTFHFNRLAIHEFQPGLLSAVVSNRCAEAGTQTQLLLVIGVAAAMS